MTSSTEGRSPHSGTPGRSVLNTGEAAALALNHYGVHGVAEALPSERDQNFRITSDAGQRYVLKVSNANEDLSFLEAQEQAIGRCRARQLPVTEFVLSVGGTPMVRVNLPTGSHVLRLVSYLDGTPMAEIAPRTPDLYRQLGAVLAEMDVALSDFNHPILHRDFQWNVLGARETVRRLGPLVTDPDERAILNTFCDHFEQSVHPLLEELPHQAIHGDAHDYNVLVSDVNPRTKPDSDRHISGVIDFGDMVHSVRIAEVSVAATYAMMDTADPISILCSIAAGYHAHSPLQESEIAVLFDLVKARLCLSVSVCAKQKREEPDNDYLRISEQPAWNLLKKLAAYPDALALFRVRSACGLEPFPGHSDLVTWLRRSRDTFSPVINPDPRDSSAVVFDFSVGTLEWAPHDMMNPLVAGKRLFERMDACEAHIGVGRYDEARLVYAGKQYEDAEAEKRTIHLGMDLFQREGAPVFAPLPGTVFSVKNKQIAYDYGPVVVLKHEPERGPVFYTLYGHLSIESIAGLDKGMTIDSGEMFARIGSSSENGGWVPHLHFQIIGDMLGSDGDFIGVALASQRSVWKSICPDPNLIVGIPQRYFPTPSLDARSIQDKRAAFIGPSLSLSYRAPIHVLRGYMQFLYDQNGRAFLDAVNNVPHVGHSHPRVVEAAHRQMTALNTNTRYLHENLVRYAERLAATMPDPLQVVYLVNSGSEANDLALRMAKTATNRSDVITVEGAYHGNLSALIDVSPYKYDGPGGRGAPASTHEVSMPDPYRGAYRSHSAETGRAYAGFVGQAVERSGNVAAFICESALSCGGQIFLPYDYLAGAYAAVRAAGGLCIADEVQVGMGRLGTHFWGFQTQGVIPDIVTIGKPIGNGHPLGAVVTTREIADAFNNGMEYFNTFGGNPVSCAIGLAVLDVLEDEQLQDHAHRVGSYLLEGLKSVAAKHPIVGDVRGQGLFVGIEFVRDPDSLEPAASEASYIVNRLRDKGILTSTDGPLHNVIKIKPPLVFSTENADQLLDTLSEILREDFVQVNPIV